MMISELRFSMEVNRCSLSFFIPQQNPCNLIRAGGRHQGFKAQEGIINVALGADLFSQPREDLRQCVRVR